MTILELERPAVAGARGIRVNLAPYRTVVETAELRIASHAVTARCLGSTITGDWNFELAANAEASLDIQWKGERPRVASTLWIDSTGESIVKNAGIAGVDGEAYVERMRRIFHERGLFVASLSDENEHFTPQHYFYELDRETNPALLLESSPAGSSLAERAEIVLKLLTCLEQRLVWRATTEVGTELPASDALQSIAPVEILALSRVQTDLFDRYFREPGQPFRRDEAGAAYDWFAGGALKTPGTLSDDPCNGTPNSALYFAFAEFALHCLRRRTELWDESLVPSREAELWSAMLPALVRSQKIYTLRYKPPGTSPYRFREWGQASINGPFPLSKSKLHALRECFDNRSITELFEAHWKHCREAFALG